MSMTKQPLLLLQQSVPPGRMKLEAKPELVQRLAELLMQKLKRERALRERK